MKDFRALINSWPLPAIDAFEGKQIVYKFDDFDIKSPQITDYYADDYGAKFCLYDLETQEALVSIGFVDFPNSVNYLYKKNTLKIELVYIHQAHLRQHGIATYYIKKIQEYAMSQGIEQIRITVNTNACLFDGIDRRNTLPQQSLIQFYEGLENPKVPFYLLV